MSRSVIANTLNQHSNGFGFQKSKPTKKRLRLLVLGVGNLLMSDDGVGVHAVNALRKKPRAGVFVTEVGTSVLDAVPFLCWADRVLVIDALHASGPPGTLYFAKLADILQEQGTLSLHELDLSAALAFMPPEAPLPETFVLGVQPASLDMGLELSLEVLAAIPKIEEFVSMKLIEWKRERIPND
jgi:hydrogenase maturation protease